MFEQKDEKGMKKKSQQQLNVQHRLVSKIKIKNRIHKKAKGKI